MKFLIRPDTGARIEADDVMNLLLAGSTDPLQLTLLDLKLSKMKLQRVTNENLVVMVCPLEEEQDVPAKKLS